jgi:glycosyltransferase involved in cell wall biosynthesis
MIRAINPLKDIIAYIKIKKHLKKIKPDIVHTHSAKAGILGRFAAASIRSSPDSKGLPAIVHTIHGLSFHPYQNPLINKFYIHIEKSASSRRTDAFISVADAMTQKALYAGIGKPGQYTTAYSAIDEQPFLKGFSEQQITDFRRKHGISTQATVITTIARLAELKGHEFVVESAKTIAQKHSDCIWLFVGDGSLTDEIKEHIKLSSLRYNFIFTGLLPPDQIPLALHSSDILVHCSLREGLARVLPQAMLCEKPVVSFDIDGAKEVVNEHTGRLIEPLNIQQLTKAGCELIENPQLRKQLGKNGREFVKEMFKPEKMTDTIEQVYQQLV